MKYVSGDSNGPILIEIEDYLVMKLVLSFRWMVGIDVQCNTNGYYVDDFFFNLRVKITGGWLDRMDLLV